MTTIDLGDYYPGFKEFNVEVPKNATFEGNTTLGDANSDTTTVYGSSKLYFRDTGLYIQSSSDGQLDIVADTTIALSGAVTFDGDVTVTWASDGEDMVITKTDTGGTAGSGGYGIKYTGTFTADAASAHKGIYSQVNYEPPSDDGTACPIGMEGQVTVKGDLTESNNYPGYGYGLQGKFHLKDGATINSGDLDPGSTYAGVRGVLTDAGSATLTKGTFAAIVGESQVSQDADNTNFRTYLGWFRCQGSGTSTDVTAGIRIESGDAWGNNIQKGISMRDCVDGIHIEPSGMTNAFNFEGSSGCVGTGTGLSQGGNIDGYIKLKIDGSTLYVNCYDAAPT